MKDKAETKNKVEKAAMKDKVEKAEAVIAAMAAPIERDPVETEKPEEAKAEKKKAEKKAEPKGNAQAVAKYLAALKKRRPDFPNALLEGLKGHKTKGEAQRAVKTYLSDNNL